MPFGLAPCSVSRFLPASSHALGGLVLLLFVDSSRLRPCPYLGYLPLSLGLALACLACLLRCLALFRLALFCFVVCSFSALRLGRSVLGVGGGLALVVGSGWLVLCGLLVVVVVASGLWFGAGGLGSAWPLRRGGWAGGLLWVLWWVGGLVVGWCVDLW